MRPMKAILCAMPARQPQHHPKEIDPLSGLTSREARSRLERDGPNDIAKDGHHPWAAFFSHFWSPVPWLLEAAFALELLLGNGIDAGIIAALLIFNALLSFSQERRAAMALTLLRHRLHVIARVLRDGRWHTIPAREIVTGDSVFLRAGDLVPADIRIGSGGASVDESSLTGEAMSVEKARDAILFAGSILRRGEARGEVIATGGRTSFGKTAELIRTAASPGHLERMILSLVRRLLVFDILVIAVVAAIAFARGMTAMEIIPFALILLIAAIPVALPATYTLAGTLGALALVRKGVLVTRLSAIEDAAAMDTLLSDKTGTITENSLEVSSVQPLGQHQEADVLQYASLSCEAEGTDSIDVAILAAAKRRKIPHLYERMKFIPFDPQTKRSEATVRDGSRTLRIIKGAPGVIAALAGVPDSLGGHVERLGRDGSRVLAVAIGQGRQWDIIGLIALHDPPRSDAGRFIGALHSLGIRVLMVTGDGIATAKAVAARVGITGGACSGNDLQEKRIATDCAVFARVLPEQKFQLAKQMQRDGRIVGMTGDGINDAPALRQAEVGIAVADATDIAKASASIVLTEPGLGGVLESVRTGRRISRRMRTYTLNKIVKTLLIALLLSIGFAATGIFALTPRLMLLLLFTNDVVTMSLASDQAAVPMRPDRWTVRSLFSMALWIAATWLLFSLGAFFTFLPLPLSVPQVQTAMFVLLVLIGQATVYLVRTDAHLWSDRPGRWLLAGSLSDAVIVSVLAVGGILMAAIPVSLLLSIVLAVCVYMVLLDFLKTGLFIHRP